MHLLDDSIRVMHAYKSALLMLRYHVELWHDGAMFLMDGGKREEVWGRGRLMIGNFVSKKGV